MPVCPLYLEPWLWERGSLTHKLKHYTDLSNIVLINQEWKTPNFFDKNTLSLTSDLIFNREIYMQVHTIPWWYAKTLIPKKTFVKRQLSFSQLHEHSLGDILFFDKNIKRLKFNPHKMLSKQIEYFLPIKALAKEVNYLWARRSIFSIENEPLFLIEIFLPNMLESLCKNL